MSPKIAESKTIIDKLCRDHHVRRLELFGSAAVGKDQPQESDLDFLVEFDSLPRGAYANAYLYVAVVGRTLPRFRRQIFPQFRQPLDRPPFC